MTTTNTWNADASLAARDTALGLSHAALTQAERRFTLKRALELWATQDIGRIERRDDDGADWHGWMAWVLGVDEADSTVTVAAIGGTRRGKKSARKTSAAISVKETAAKKSAARKPKRR